MLERANQILWAIATASILLSGVYFTFRLKGIQFGLRKMMKKLLEKEDTKGGISPVQTLMMSLAGRIGVGSIAGVALAIYMGGVGSIFWMWMIALISAANTFAETVLGVRYKEKDHGNLYVGGPSYYMKKGVKKPYLGMLYAILIFVSYIIGFLGIQSNTIVKSMQEITYVPAVIIGLVIVVLSGLIIFGGVTKIANATGKLVPIMTVVYVATALFVLVKNITMVPGILGSIFAQAFRLDSFFSAFIPTFIVGIQRGLFSNEAGIGTGSIAASATNSTDARKQGYLQMLGIYITTFLICTSTAIIILTSNYQSISGVDMNGIELTQHAFTYHLGIFGTVVVFLSIILFSFSTILTGYYYGESSLKFMYGSISRRKLFFVKLFTLFFILLGAIISSNLLWKVVDLFVAALAIMNTYAMIKLRDEVAIEK